MSGLFAGQINSKRAGVLVGIGVLLLGLVLWRYLKGDSDPDPEQRDLARIDQLERKKDFSALSDFTRSSRQKVAIHAVGALARAKGPTDGIVYLTETLGDERDFIRETAAREYGNIGTRQDVTALVKVAMKDQAANVRCGAAASLGKLKAWDGMEPLVDALDDADLNVRKAAIAAVQSIAGAAFPAYKPDDPPPKRRAGQQMIRGMMPGLKRGYDRYLKRLESQGKTL